MNARPVMVTQQTLRNLALGDKFFLRVAAVSSAGAGPPAALDQPVHIREIVGKPSVSCPSPSQAPCLVDRAAEASGQREQGRHSPTPYHVAQDTCCHIPALKKFRVPLSACTHYRCLFIIRI